MDWNRTVSGLPEGIPDKFTVCGGMDMELYSKCHSMKGRWARFHTPWGVHEGVVEQVVPGAVLMRVPRHFAPTALASVSGMSADQKLDLALAQWIGPRGPMGWGAPGPYPPGPGVRGPGCAAPGCAGPGWWAAGWWWWWVAFALILGLAFLW